MSLVPRWEVMTNEAKALTKRIAVSALVLLLAFWIDSLGDCRYLRVLGI